MSASAGGDGGKEEEVIGGGGGGASSSGPWGQPSPSSKRATTVSPIQDDGSNLFSAQRWFFT